MAQVKISMNRQLEIVSSIVIIIVTVFTSLIGSNYLVWSEKTYTEEEVLALAEQHPTVINEERSASSGGGKYPVDISGSSSTGGVGNSGVGDSSGGGGESTLPTESTQEQNPGENISPCNPGAKWNALTQSCYREETVDCKEIEFCGTFNCPADAESTSDRICKTGCDSLPVMTATCTDVCDAIFDYEKCKELVWDPPAQIEE